MVYIWEETLKHTNHGRMLFLTNGASVLLIIPFQGGVEFDIISKKEGGVMKQPIISIDRASKTYAIFDGLNLMHGFMDYVDENGAIKAAKDEIVKHTWVTPEIVYPRVTDMKIK